MLVTEAARLLKLTNTNSSQDYTNWTINIFKYVTVLLKNLFSESSIDIASHRMASPCVASHCIASDYVGSCRVVSDRVVSYHIVAYRIASHCVESHRIALNHNVFQLRNKRCFQCLHRLMQAKETFERTREQITTSQRSKVKGCTWFA